MTQDEIAESIAFLTTFKADILAEFNSSSVESGERDPLRIRINRAIPRARSLLAQAGTLKAVALSPPSAIGGLMVSNADPFDYILESYYGMSLAPTVADMIEQAIGVMEGPDYLERVSKNDAAHGDRTRALARVLRLCERFPHVLRQLRDRHANRRSLEIEDEYDVQDLLRALLRIDFDDVRHEEWTPSYAGGSSRLDFLLKAERIVVETKKTRPSLGAREIGDQLLIDIGRYGSHPDCGTLICFIYDPELRIGNPTGLIRDLNGKRDGIDVHVVIAPGDSPSGV